MKRFFAVLLAVSMLGSILAGCGDGKPAGMTDNVYEYGCKALDIVNQYLDTDIEADAAHDKLKQIEATIDPQSDDVAMKATEGSIKIEVQYLAFLMVQAQNEMRNLESTIDEIKEWRDKLSSNLGK